MRAIAALLSLPLMTAALPSTDLSTNERLALVASSGCVELRGTRTARIIILCNDGRLYFLDGERL
jgi:hypothetical protein